MRINININRRTVIYSAMFAIGLWTAWSSFRAGGFAAGASTLFGLVLWVLIIWGVTAALKKCRRQYDSQPEPARREGASKIPAPAKKTKFNPVLTVVVMGLFLGISTALNKPSFWSVLGGLCWIGLLSFVAWIMYHVTDSRYTDTTVTVRGIRHAGKSWLVSAYSPDFNQYIDFTLPERTTVEVTQQVCVLVTARFRPYWNGQIVDVEFDSLVSTDLIGRMSSIPSDEATPDTHQATVAGNGWSARRGRAGLRVVPGGKK